jgi:DNA-binding protein HU-beta
LRSFHETASYVSNSAVDSPGVTMSAFEGDGRVGNGRRGAAHGDVEALDFRIGAGNRAPQSNGEATMNKLELVDHIATEAELTKVSAAAALEAVLEGIVDTLRKGEEVRLVGFGTFSVRERAAGKGRNPATGKEIKIAASKNARFKPGAALKASLNKKSVKK